MLRGRHRGSVFNAKSLFPALTSSAAKRLNRFSAVLLFLTAGLLSAADAPPAEEANSAERKVELAVEAQNRGWLVSARKLLEEAAAADPNTPGLKFYRALQELREGHPRRAAAFARSSLAAEQKVADCRTLLGLVALRDKDFAEAERQMREAIAADPENGRGYYNLSEVLRWQGRPREALEQLELAQQKQPGDPVLPLKIRLTHIEVGDRLTFVRPKTDSSAPDASWTLTEAALALRGGKIEKAAALLDQARRELPPAFFFPLLKEDHFFQTYKSEPGLERFFE
jgi:tetratricopeptide (TPR) repeat protein